MSAVQTQNQGQNRQEETVQTDLQQAPAPVQQQSAPIEVNYPRMLGEILPSIREHKDLVNFAYFLYKNNLVKLRQQDDEEYVCLQQQVNFCSRGKCRATGASLMDTSPLEQMYITSMFGGDYYTVLWLGKAYLPHSIYDRCDICSLCKEQDLAYCPYALCHIITKTAEAYGISPESVFSDILGDEKIPFRGLDVKALPVAIPAEELQGIQSKSAHSAHLLLAARLVQTQSMEETVAYTHLPICRNDRKESVVEAVMDFWKTGSGVSCSINPGDKASLLYSKTEGCKRCTFEQCPHKLAAYFCYLGKKYNVDPLDLASYAAHNTTYAGIAVSDNFQFSRFLSAVQKAPMREESKAEFVKMYHFIAGRKVNNAIPFLPFNLAVTSPDKEKAGEIIKNFTDALWYFDYYRRGCDRTETKDIYISTVSFEELCAAYKETHPATTFVLHDIHLLCENEQFKAGHHKLLKIMQDRREDVMSIVTGEKEEIATFFSTYPLFREKIFAKTLEMFDMDSGSILEMLEDKLTQIFTVSEEMMGRLEQYVRITYPASPLRGTAFVNDLYEKLLFNHYNYDVHASDVLRNSDLPYVKPPRSEMEIFEEIDQLTGLANVKEELRNVNNLVKFNIKMGSSNKNAVNLHMVFTGNPGTGKTTVAKLTAEILYSIGFIQENKVVICSAKDLIGQYRGQTTPKTAQKCQQAYNGVLFIDEAYQLNPYISHDTDDFKEECIAELIQQMENNRDKLVVIFAGYTEEMEDFLNRANTGLRSRIGKTIHFPDYSPAELLEIFTKIVEKSGMRLGAGADQRALEIFENAKKDAKRFGNARYARNLYERSLIQHAAITSYMDKDNPALKILCRDEITIPNT